MKYLLDSNVFIEAKNRYYGFDICPGFWEWLKESDEVRSLDEVEKELEAEEDDLSKWVKDHLKSYFFYPKSHEIQENYSEIVEYVRELNVLVSAKNSFLSVADGWLIAAAMHFQVPVVTHEVSAPGAKKRIKLPDVARHFQVSCFDTFEMLRRERVKFVR